MTHYQPGYSPISIANKPIGRAVRPSGGTPQIDNAIAQLEDAFNNLSTAPVSQIS
tara:strand:- start:563 stop:727 length:165 start_codon:yes stop_codon:yes gene_type:complete